jgi:hypothetical protein
MFTLQLNKSSKKIADLTSEMSLMQVIGSCARLTFSSDAVFLVQSKLNDEICGSKEAMTHRVDLKIEEMKGEIKFLTGVIE